MSKYINFNSNAINNQTNSIFSQFMKAGSSIKNNTFIIIGVILLFCIVAYFFYYYYVVKVKNIKYHSNNEGIPNDQQTSNEVELLLFYADWCPACKEAKPAWNELKTDYENKSINGYKIMFTEIDCSNQDDIEVSKIINKYSIEGYPKIKLIKDGQLIDFDAKPSKDNLISFLNNVL